MLSPRIFAVACVVALASTACQQGAKSSTPQPTVATASSANTNAATVTNNANANATPMHVATNGVSMGAPGQPGAVAPNQLTVVVSPATGVAQAEDGLGAVVAAQDPVFIDVGGGVGGQALAPELAVGQLRFREHRYPSPGVVRFVCANKASLPRDAEVALVYGDKRVVVANALEVP